MEFIVCCISSCVCDIIFVAGSLGTSYPKITNLNLCRTRVGISQSYGVRTWTLQRPQLYSGLSISRRSEKVSHVRSAPSLEIICKFLRPSVSKSSNVCGYQYFKIKILKFVGLLFDNCALMDACILFSLDAEVCWVILCYHGCMCFVLTSLLMLKLK